MPCPYAEKKGPVVYCRLAGRKVNPLAYPCLTNRYERCKIYREKAGKPAEAKPAPKPEQRPAPPSPQLAQPPARAAQPAPAAARGPRGEVKGLTIDGRKPRSCRECIYYGERTRTCLLLGITVEDPDDPPCARL